MMTADNAHPDRTAAIADTADEELLAREREVSDAVSAQHVRDESSRIRVRIHPANDLFAMGAHYATATSATPGRVRLTLDNGARVNVPARDVMPLEAGDSFTWIITLPYEGAVDEISDDYDNALAFATSHLGKGARLILDVENNYH